MDKDSEETILTRWDKLKDCMDQCNFNDSNNKKEEIQQKSEYFEKLLRECVFKFMFTNNFFLNRIDLKSKLDDSLEREDSRFKINLIGDSFIDSCFRLMIKFSQSNLCPIELSYFKETIHIILNFLRLNDGHVYHYIQNELFSFLIALHQIQNDYLNSTNRHNFALDDIQQLNTFITKYKEFDNHDCLIDIQVPISNIKLVRLCYVQLLEILSENEEPVQDLSDISSKVDELIQLNLICSTKEMDGALICFLNNYYFAFNFKSASFQNYFHFVCSLTDRYSLLSIDSIGSDELERNKQLDRLWESFCNCLNLLHEDSKTNQLMFYLTDNIINLQKIKNDQFLHHILPKVLYELLKHLINGPDLKAVYQRLITRVLDHYLMNASESCLQSDEYCKLIKCCLIYNYNENEEDMQQISVLNHSYMFKFWDFLNQNSDSFLFESKNLLIKLINIANALLPCIHYIKIRDHNFPSFFDPESINRLVNVFLEEFKKPIPLDEELKDDLIEQIYVVLENYIKLANESDSTIEFGPTPEQIAVLYLPWHEQKLKFVKEQQQLMNCLTRRSFTKSQKIYRICLSSIAKLSCSKVLHYEYQLEFFDFILNKQFKELEPLIKSEFINYMLVARFSEETFRSWFEFAINVKDEKFIPSILGKMSCLLFKLSTMTFENDENEVEVKYNLKCVHCSKVFDEVCEEESVNLELVPLIRKEFKKNLNLNSLDNLSILISESSAQFFNHIDTDEGLINNVLDLFNLVDQEMSFKFSQLLDNMFNSLKQGKEGFFASFRKRFLKTTIDNKMIIQEKIVKFENISLVCRYFPKEQLQIIIFLIKNGVLYNRDFTYYLPLILRRVIVLENDQSISDYFLDNKQILCEEILNEILEIDVSSNVAFDYLYKFLILFEDHRYNFNSLFPIAFQIIFPFLIKSQNPRSKPLLVIILKGLTFDKYENLILNYFDHWILYFVRNMSIDEIKAGFEYIKELTDLDICKLFPQKGRIVYSLLFEYGNYLKPTNYLLSIINEENIKHDNGLRPSKKFVDFNENYNALSEYLTENMGGYLLNLNTEFIKQTNLTTKTLLLKSLDQIIKIISSKTISNYFEKFIAILRSAFTYQSGSDDDYQNYIHYMLQVWETLIMKCEKHDLAKNLSLICKNLMDLLQVDTAAISNVFVKLIVENEEHLTESLKEIHFLPSNCRLMNSVYSVCQKYIDKWPEGDRDIKKFESSLKFLEKIIQVENPDIKYFHYKKLLQVLNENEQCLRSFCSTSSNDLSVHPIVSRLIIKLIADSKNENHKLRSIIGECLGEFGALDPGRLKIRNELNNQADEAQFFFGTIGQPEFAVLLINKLVTYFDLINESKLQDCINYALQEILKNYQVRVKDKYKQEIWSKLQPRCKSLCQQLFNSKFIVCEEIKEPTHPVYKDSQQFLDWIINWCIRLIYRIKVEFAKKIFISLCPLMRYYASFAEYMLPFIIIVILINGDQVDKDEILEEVDCVIQSCLSDHNAQQNMEVDQENKENDTKTSQQITVLYEAKSEQYKCIHTIFALHDFLSNWCKKSKNLLMIKNKIIIKQKIAIEKEELWHRYSAINQFIGKISKSELSILAASCQSYDRSLMYLEEYISGNAKELSNNFDNLQKLYVALDEPDGVEGIIVCRKEESSLYNSILSHEVNGELQEAISCCEKANKIYPNDLSYSKIYLRCLLLLGHENTAKIFATNSISQQEDFIEELQPFIVEAAWKMGDWENLENQLNVLENKEQKFEVGIGKLCVAMGRNDHKLFDDNIQILRLNEVNQISVSSIDGKTYSRNYTNLIRLHMLNEIEHYYKKYFHNLKSKKELVTSLTNRFTFRTKIVQSSVRLKEPIINLQRVLLNICSTNQQSGHPSELAKLWLSSAKLARKSNNFQSAYNFLLEIQLLEQQNSTFSKDLRAKIVIEKAKYYWQKDTLEEKEKAVKELYRGIEQLNLKIVERNYPSLRSSLTFAKLHLLYNNYSERTLNLDCETLKNNYTSIACCYNNWEESYYNLGIYFDNVANTLDQSIEKADLFDKVIRNLGQSLKYGSKHVFESMPKLLTAWFEIGDLQLDLTKKQSNAKTKTKKQQQDDADLVTVTKCCDSSTRTIKIFLDQIAPYNFHTAVSQLTSRMCYPLSQVSGLISDILTRLVKVYPHQTIWMLLSSLLSDNITRKEKCDRLVRKPEVNFQLVNNYMLFGSILCKICTHDCSGTSFNLDEQLPALKRQIAHSQTNNLPLVVPYQCFMNVNIPCQTGKDESNLPPIKENLVFISSINNNVELLKSLVKPKKITIKGTDGKDYLMMCKPKDDLRKDNRAMEFNNLVNRLLRKDSETRKRNLFIKTYTVIPLRHDCGLIEWINDLEGYRMTVLGTYRSELDNFKLDWEKIQGSYPKKTSSLEEAKKTFVKEILPLFPTIYHKWFLNQYQNPTCWYNARSNYIRSCAVMSIVGYIIGLGDRHGENILIHLKTGNLVHVDFNCIFNKGAELDVPERVPFRLTHNMLSAMGPTGYEGIFRKTCESTLRIMREQKEALMSVLTTFVHDPLIEWNKNTKTSTRGQSKKLNTENEQSETTNKTAIENLDRIRYRLNGLLGLDCKKEESAGRQGNRSMANQSFILSQTINNNSKIPISVNYQVSHLIEEATKLDNLCRMYIGWGSFY